MAQLGEALRYKPEGRGFDSRCCHWNFSLTRCFRSHYDARGDSASNRNEYQEYFLGGKGGPVRRADNLTTFMCRLSWTLGASVSCNTRGLSRPVKGMLYLYLYTYKPCKKYYSCDNKHKIFRQDENSFRGMCQWHRGKIRDGTVGTAPAVRLITSATFSIASVLRGESVFPTRVCRKLDEESVMMQQSARVPFDRGWKQLNAFMMLDKSVLRRRAASYLNLNGF